MAETVSWGSPSRLKGIETFSIQFCLSSYLLCWGSPSRLKGIETSFAYEQEILLFRVVRKDLPVWRELKRIVLAISKSVEWCSERPSHLKGIETCAQELWEWWGTQVEEVLPVWRELKLHQGSAFHYESVIVLKVVPVWRELKHWFLRPARLPIPVRKDLPVWRELKLLYHWLSLSICFSFGKTFPFEGNWNH